ncbi:MAG: Hsp20/alpha crystallin family protein, partial [Candidatus Binataceae bacterium]
EPHSRPSMWFKDIERAIDEFFDDVLVARWRSMAEPQDAVVRDFGDRYEIELEASGLDPSHLDIEVVGHVLSIRHRGGALEGAFTFAAPIDADAVKAQWNDGLLLILVPKLKGRRVPVEKF